MADNVRAKGPVLRTGTQSHACAMLMQRLLCLIVGHRYNHKLKPDGMVRVICNRCGKTMVPLWPPAG